MKLVFEFEPELKIKSRSWQLMENELHPLNRLT